MKIFICILAIATFFFCFNVCYAPPAQKDGGCHEPNKSETQISKSCCLTNAILSNPVHFVPVVNESLIQTDSALLNEFDQFESQSRLHPSTDPPHHSVLRI